jgi:hypothetical protein
VDGVPHGATHSECAADGMLIAPVCGGYAEMEGGRRGGTLRRLTTLGVKVARPWAGLLRYAPHGVLQCG